MYDWFFSMGVTIWLNTLFTANQQRGSQSEYLKWSVLANISEFALITMEAIITGWKVFRNYSLQIFLNGWLYNALIHLRYRKGTFNPTFYILKSNLHYQRNSNICKYFGYSSIEILKCLYVASSLQTVICPYWSGEGFIRELLIGWIRLEIHYYFLLSISSMI